MFSQNLIPNASFETPINFEKESENNWHRYMEYHSPDYFNFSSKNEINNVFDKYIGGAKPSDGEAFAGIFCYRVNERKNIKNIREYIETSLTETLVKDSLYEFSFDICLDSESNIALKNFEVLFTSKPNEFNKEYKAFRSNPQIEFDSLFIDDSKNWISLNAKYLAKGYENYIVFGNFNSDKQTEIKEIIIENKTNKKEKWNLERNELAAYYYIDNLKLKNITNPNPVILSKKDTILFSNIDSACLKTKVSDEKTSFSRHAKVEKPQFTGVNEDFSDEHNAENGVFAQRLDSIKIDSAIVLSNVNFIFNTSTLLEESFPELMRLLEIMNTKPNIKIKIIGHTDNIGTPEYNMNLSIERAMSVRQYLIDNGINDDRIEYEGLGLSKPLLENKTEEARKVNRRVEFKIISK